MDNMVEGITYTPRAPRIKKEKAPEGGEYVVIREVCLCSCVCGYAEIPFERGGKQRKVVGLSGAYHRGVHITVDHRG